MISHNQHGFKTGCSTLSNLLNTYSVILKYIDSGKPIDLISIDLSKAFDKIDHFLLIETLFKEGFDPRIVRLIDNFLTDRFHLVKIDDVQSKKLPVTSGVPQGTILEPILFNIFLNGVLKISLNCENCINSYADDLKRFGSPGINLSDDLSKVISWLNSNGMEVNESKCVVLHFGKYNPRNAYFINNNKIEPVHQFRDLGIIIDDQLSFTFHTQQVCTRAYKTLNLFFRMFFSKNVDIYIKMYKVYVLPIILYCCSLYCPPRNRSQLNWKRFKDILLEDYIREGLPVPFLTIRLD